VPGIFISYRRGDSQGSAGRLFDDLKRRFPQEQIFIDVDSIAIGEDFQDAIERYVTSCHVQLVVIGPDWLGLRGSTEAPRLHDAEDFVRIEVKSALERKIPVVPILVQGATMPRKEQLPSGLERLVRRNAVELRHTRWDDDIAELMNALERMPRPDAPGGQQLLQPTPSCESPAVSALMQRLLIARSINDLEAIAFEVEALERERPDDLEVARLKRRVQDAMRVERAPPAAAAPAPRQFSRRPLFAAAAAVVAVIGGVLVYQVTRTPEMQAENGLVVTAPAEPAPAEPPKQAEPEPSPPPKEAEPQPSPVERPAEVPLRMPHLIGSTLRLARSALANANIDITVHEIGEESTRPPGTIIRQEPAPGAEVARRGVATLIYAMPVQLRMPRLVGLDVKAAMAAVANAGLVVQSRSAEPTTRATPFIVIWQDPVADAAVKEGQGIAFAYAIAPDTCVRGYVWREAFPGDHVCVTPETREQTQRDNALADRRRAGRGAYGPDSCVTGYVWRVARPDDLVCVTPQTRDQVAEDNAAAPQRVVGAVKR
jgi:hypothetical protein